MTAPVPVMPRPDRPRDGRAIYVAGASAERERIARYMGALRDAGWTVTEDWPAAEAASGLTDEQLDDAAALAAAERDLAGVRLADVFWLVAPTMPSIGAWIEYGHALKPPRRAEVIVSGRCPSIFARCASQRFPAHVDALHHLTQRWAPTEATRALLVGGARG